ncbi:MAG: hypothetical protein JWO94_2616 [Verrucomicrobiaceae bacterium]|nr:hypothetical protein [Verrucomicrobiaceae bacterium]
MVQVSIIAAICPGLVRQQSPQDAGTGATGGADRLARQGGPVRYDKSMSVAIEHIKEEIRSLAPAEVEALLHDLHNEYVLPPNGLADDASIESAWEAEISARVKDVEEGKVKLISSAELRRSTDVLFAELGIKRPA